MNYYNEFDPFAAKWLRNLASADQIPGGPTWVLLPPGLKDQAEKLIGSKLRRA